MPGTTGGRTPIKPGGKPGDRNKLLLLSKLKTSSPWQTWLKKRIQTSHVQQQQPVLHCNTLPSQHLPTQTAQVLHIPTHLHFGRSSSNPFAFYQERKQVQCNDKIKADLELEVHQGLLASCLAHSPHQVGCLQCLPAIETKHKSSTLGFQGGLELKVPKRGASLPGGRFAATPAGMLAATPGGMLPKPPNATRCKKSQRTKDYICTEMSTTQKSKKKTCPT